MFDHNPVMCISDGIRAKKSSRKNKAFNDVNIQAELATPCGCARGCNDLLSTTLVLRWRAKYHTLPMGFRQKQCLLTLYKETIFGEKFPKPCHIVEGMMVCGYVLNT